MISVVPVTTVCRHMLAKLRLWVRFIYSCFFLRLEEELVVAFI